jgi:DNA-binding Xre family transcriptional regulator
MINCKLNVKRAEFHLSQKALSDMTGIRLQTISDMETGKTKAYSAENLSKLCQVFMCQIICS